MRLTTSFLGVLLCALAATAAEQPPNVIVVMTDDQGYGELSAHGTPCSRRRISTGYAVRVFGWPIFT